MDFIYFWSDLKSDPKRCSNYTCMSVTSYKVLLEFVNEKLTIIIILNVTHKSTSLNQFSWFIKIKVKNIFN